MHAEGTLATPTRGRVIGTIVLGLLLVAIAVVYVVLYRDDLSPLSRFFGDHPYDGRGRFPGYRISLVPDKFALTVGFGALALLLVSHLSPRLPNGRRTGPMRLLLVIGVLGFLPLAARLLALGMALLSVAVGLGVAALVIWIVVRYVRGR